MRRPSLLLSAWFFVLGSSCAAVELEAPTLQDPGPRTPDAGEPEEPPEIPVDGLPSVEITSPLNGAAAGPGLLRIEGKSRDDRGVASVLVKVGPNVAQLAKTEDNFRHWWIESAAPGGMFLVEAEARDTAQQRSNPDRITLLGELNGSDDAAPSVSILSPPDGSAPLHTQVLVSGTALDDRAVVSMDVLRNGELLKERFVETDTFFATWSRLVPLIPGAINELVFIAKDAGGREGRASITLTGRAQVDREAPKLTVLAPVDQQQLSAAHVKVHGTATDDIGVREVKVRVATLDIATQDWIWGEYAFAQTQDGYQTWEREVALPAGAVQIEVRAIDLNGLASKVAIHLVNAFQAPWTEEIALPLKLRADTGSPVLRFDLDRKGVSEVISDDVQKDIRVLELDTTSLLTSALTQIKESCGVDWRQDNADPKHDCSKTELGRTFGAGTTWRTSPEYSFVRLLTMTPANVVVAGTSISGLQGIADTLGTGGGFRTILRETLGIARTREIVTTPSVVTALRENWLASHPAVSADAKLPITLYDVMQDLASIADRFGPASGHPGILDPSFTPRSVVLGPQFRMILEARSNLRWLDGVDLSGDGLRAQKDYMAHVVDTVGPTYDDVLEFDFNDPTKFDIPAAGLVAAPTVDLRMRVLENAVFVPACTEGNACKNHKPATPYKNYIWTQPKWELERLLAAAALNDYASRSGFKETYNSLGFIPSAWVTVGADDNPAGWTTFRTLASLGDPPPPQYLWELILEVGQVALHRIGSTTIAEGAADVAFTLRNINVGLTANEIRAAMRPELQRQRRILSDRLLGDYAANNGAVDFYYRRGADNEPYLFFAAAEDPRPTDAYAYKKPGFFADADLSQKLSTKNAGTSGDSSHEKLALSTGETTVYMEDDQAKVYRLRIVVGADAAEIQVYISRKVL